MVPSERILLNGLPARRLSLSDFGFLYPLAAPPADSRSQISDFFIPWRRRAPRSLTRRRRRFLFSEIRLPMAVGPIELRGSVATAGWPLAVHAQQAATPFSGV